jgi:hypothetical protein
LEGTHPFFRDAYLQSQLKMLPKLPRSSDRRSTVLGTPETQGIGFPIYAASEETKTKALRHRGIIAKFHKHRAVRKYNGRNMWKPCEAGMNMTEP